MGSGDRYGCCRGRQGEFESSRSTRRRSSKLRFEPRPDSLRREAGASRYVTLRVLYALPQCFSNVSAIALGVGATAMPASFNAAIFAAAVPFPPLTIAPAWPMRRPGGALAPAMNAATGFLQFAFTHAAA